MVMGLAKGCNKECMCGEGRKHPPPNLEADSPQPRSNPVETSTETVGTHPTGMHSCFEIILINFLSQKK